MKKLVLVFVGAILIGVSTLSAKSLPSVAEKLPAEFKNEITKRIDYPAFAKHNLIEGEVWMKVTLTEESEVKVIELSATNPELGEYVKNELSSMYLGNSDCKVGQVYFLKVKFDLLQKS